MYGALSGEGVANDPVVTSKDDSGSGNQQHNLNTEQFTNMLGKGGKGAGAGEAAGVLTTEELALAAA